MPTHILPFRQDLAAFCAETVVSDLAYQLPDLSNAILLVPEATARIRAQFVALRKSLSDSAKQRGYDAIIPPVIATPRQLYTERHAATDEAIVNLRAALDLATALYGYKDLFPYTNKWQLTDDMISIFDEISEYNYATQLSNNSMEKKLQALGATWQDDTRILLKLWHAWKSLYDEKNYPSFSRYQMLLAGTYTEAHEHVYLCGIKHLSPCFQKWVRNLYKNGRLTWIVKANACSVPVAYHPIQETLTGLTEEDVDSKVFPNSDTDYGCFLDRVYSTWSPNALVDVPFAERAHHFADEIDTSPLDQRVRLFFPMTTEEHAWGIYIAVRHWLKCGHQCIALISLDRRLSRRIRAIFEKHGIPLIDYSGWELSTTSSAAAFRHLLGEVEEVSNIKTVLALIRSPYCDLEVKHDDAIAAADYIEYLLSRYSIQHRHVDKIISTLGKIASDNSSPISIARKVADTLSLVEELKDGKEHSYSDYFDRLFNAMKKLGMYKNLSEDSAGQRLIAELQRLYKVVSIEKEQVRFNIWHSLILHSMEKSNFRPDLPDHGVFLMNPEQAELMQFDALAILALDNRHFPSQPQSGLINENIRRELELETHERSVGRQFLLFRTLLESAEHLLLSCQQYIQGQKTAPSTWLTALHHFHKIAYGDLTDHELQGTARLCSARNLSDKQGIEPHLQEMAQPTSSGQLWPETFSVNAYQNIIDCPYRFYARYLLKIRSRPEISDYWEAMNYGTYLHKCLQKLHTRLGDLYEAPVWLIERRTEILDEAQRILHAQFKEAATDNYVNYFWLGDALEVIAYYIDWMIEQQRVQAIVATQAEVKLEKVLSENLSMRGYADLILQTENGSVLIDYKTGTLARPKDIQSGEHIQLLSYALLEPNIKTAIYLGMGAKNKGEQRLLKADELADYHDKNLHRLLNIKADYDAERPLKAWGNKQNVCRYCDYAGLCRRYAWDDYHDWDFSS